MNILFSGKFFWDNTNNMTQTSPPLFRQFPPPLFSEFISGEQGFSSPKEAIGRLQKRFPNKRIFLPDQTHSNIILEEKDFLDDKSIPMGDAILSNSSNTIIGVRVADCIGALFYAPQKGIIGAVHAGWRGLAQKIFSSFFQRAQEKYEVLPKDFFVALSPSLGKCCAEFSEPYAETPPHFHPFVEEKNEKFFLDLWQIANSELLKNGVPEKQIEEPSFCTKCTTEQIWSYRGGQKKERNIFFLFL